MNLSSISMSGSFSPRQPSLVPSSPSGARRASVSRGFRDAQALLSESIVSAPSDEAVKVLCRVRPFNAREEVIHMQSVEGKPSWEQQPLRSVVEFRGNTCILHDSSTADGWVEKERYTFDGCLWSIPQEVQDSDNDFVSQETMFDLYGRDLLSEVWRGFNTCFFAYGQTGSGKTYSMMGDEANPGFIPRMGQCLFDQIDEMMLEAEQEGQENLMRQFRVEVRYLEIYNEMVKDLLWSLSPLSPEMKAKLNPENLKIRSTAATGVFVEGLTGVEIDSWSRMAELIDMGNLARSVASTKMNERSSRSHTIFKVTLSQVTTSIPRKQFEKPTQHLRSAQINLVDLAGSERNKKTGATGDRLKEAASINRSLMCLKQVIDALVDNSQIVKAANKKRVPYRDSHLTSVLQDSLGGNAKTWMLVCVSPHLDNLEETQNTLRYGSRARKILNQVHVNENASARLMLDLEDELDRLKAELASSAEAATPAAVDSLKAQIGAHESAIHSLEGQVEAQKQKIERLQEERDKGAKEREASAMKHLTTVMQARLQRDGVEHKLQERTDEIAALREHLIKLRSDAHSSVVESEKSDSEAKRLRLSASRLDQTIDEMKKKISKLESQRRSLQKSCEEGEQFVKTLAQDKFAMILRARLQVARIRIDHRRKLEELKLQTNKKMSELEDFEHRQERAEDDNIHAELSALHQEINSLRQQLASTKHEEEKVNAEKTSQIATLQQEVGQLQQELRRKKESHVAKLAQITGDWDKKMQSLSQETERQLQANEKEWEAKRAQLEGLRDQQKSEIVADYESRTAAVQESSDARLREVAEKGEAEIVRMQERWENVLFEKRQENDKLRDALRELSLDNQRYCAVQYRISTAMELLQKAQFTRTLSKEARTMIATALEFHALFEEYHPEKTKLDHLIKANLTLQRCAVAPILGEGAEGVSIRAKSPAARSQSPMAGSLGRSVGRSVSRANSPSVSRRGGSVPVNDSSVVPSQAPRIAGLRSVSPRAGSSSSVYSSRAS